MKNLKFKTTLFIIFFMGFICYGCINSTPNKFEKNQNTPEQEILGSWILENDSSTKIIFYNDGTVKTYEDDKLLYTDNYSISNSCQGTLSADGILFLKFIDGSNGDIECYYINGINENNNGILSLMSDNGNLLIYKRP
ncbi:MAG: hypothetical protein ACI7YS_01020 [Flavobacterium sp.]